MAVLVRRPEWLPRLGPELRLDDWSAEHRPIFQAVLGTALSGEMVTADAVAGRLTDPAARQTLEDLLQDDAALDDALRALGEGAGVEERDAPTAPPAEMREVANEVLQDLSADQPLATGSEGLDAITGGLRRGDLVLVESHAGSLAASFGLELVRGAVLSSLFGAQVLIVSPLASRRELALRLVASATPGADRALLSADDLTDVEGLLDGFPLRILEGPGLAASDVERAARDGPRLDLLAVLGADDLEGGRALARIAHGLKRLARDLDLPVVASARSTAVRLRERGSSARAADLVLGVKPTLLGTNEARVEVLWNRRGGRGTFDQLLAVGRA